jgi:hypothetical protein
MRDPLLLAAGVLLLAASATDAEAARRVKVDPIGAWSCVVYGHPAFGDEHMLFHFAADGSAGLAREVEQKLSGWTALSEWTADDGELAFSDPRTGRRYRADLDRATLGGGWRTLTLTGGWWCSPMDAASVPTVEKLEPLAVMPPLIPSLTATPPYPIQAIREAKQGRAVMCFFVDATGRVVQPEVIELSDEVFRAPILSALERSRYQGWADASVLRPGCRSYIFKLDALSAVSVE